MNKYELAVVVSAKLEDEARADVIEKVKALVTRFGGNVTDVDEWGKRRFAYEIQKMKEGYYYFVHFESDATVPGEVEQRIRIMDLSLIHIYAGIFELRPRSGHAGGHGAASRVGCPAGAAGGDHVVFPLSLIHI